MGELSRDIPHPVRVPHPAMTEFFRLWKRIEDNPPGAAAGRP
jgi:hypothetical protein